MTQNGVAGFVSSKSTAAAAVEDVCCREWAGSSDAPPKKKRRAQLEKTGKGLFLCSAVLHSWRTQTEKEGSITRCRNNNDKRDRTAALLPEEREKGNSSNAGRP